MVNNTVFIVYKSFLVKIAEREGRPFRLPKSISTMEKRPDVNCFYVLDKKLKEKQVIGKPKIDLFMGIAVKEYQTYHITDILHHFDAVYDTFKEYKEDTLVETKRKIKIAFDKLINYCIINNIESEEELKRGNPPTILKLWKGGELDERVLIYIFDLKKIKSKPWFRVYCGDLASRYSKLKISINTDVHLNSFIESELVKFKNIFLKSKE